MTPEQLRADREARLQRLEAQYASVPLEPEDEEEEQPHAPVPSRSKTGTPLEIRQLKVASLLERHGPLEWHILLMASGLKCNSLARVLKGEQFDRKEDGRWGLK